MSLNAKEVIAQSGVKFGTSGARGLVTQFTSEVCAAFAHAFLHSLSERFDFKKVAVAIDNRPSSHQMAQACVAAIESCGIEAVYYGVIPTPALAYSSIQDGIPCIMVTGSHIPFDRNGLKFYRPDGEITKVEEQAILNADVDFDSNINLPTLMANVNAAKQYIERYTYPFESDLLKGLRIGIYEHSSAGRDLYSELFSSLGAEVVSLERTDMFVPIDTEAVSEEDKQKARFWSEEYNLDFIFSTDGDGDRPLVSDEHGNWLRGDILGLLASQVMRIEALAVPVSCNSIIESGKVCRHVARTKIGSPYVIEAFSDLEKDFVSYAGFEANGGFLLGSDISVNEKTIKALPTRDAVLPALMLLVGAKGSSISTLVSQLPQRYTDSDRIQNYAVEKSRMLIDTVAKNPDALLGKLGFRNVHTVSIDKTDGLRLQLDSGDIIHLRPSGNAPELRCYAESDSETCANDLVRTTLGKLQQIDPVEL